MAAAHSRKPQGELSIVDIPSLKIVMFLFNNHKAEGMEKKGLIKYDKIRYSPNPLWFFMIDDGYLKKSRLKLFFGACNVCRQTYFLGGNSQTLAHKVKKNPVPFEHEV